MNIKIDKADKIFSQYIRTRDRKCMRCSSPVKFNDAGMPISHQNSHYFGRGKESTRFDQENCDTLCHGCHRIWGSDDREAYRVFKIKQLGENGFNALVLRANKTVKKDRKLSLIIVTELLKEVK
ncbi:MAG: recombination protein NinG [Bacteroidetes bacterium]|nr:recombination protein NinG [Bacteroidota bacterium]